MSRVLLTGIAGFAGSFLAEYLLQQEDVELHGIVHRHDRRIQHLLPHITLHRGDLRNALWVSDVVQEVQPDVALHLAAWSDVGGSWQQPWTTYELNIQCQLNLLEALRRWRPQCRTLVVSSNEVYGLVRPDDLPIDEETPLRPNSPYGVSKIAQDMMALQYWNSHRLPTIRARSFNHIGPGQADDFAASAFARQIAEIEAGCVRRSSASATWTHSGILPMCAMWCAAYWLLVPGRAGRSYNVGSGRPHSCAGCSTRCSTLTPVAGGGGVDPQRLRPSDVPCSYCDNRKLAAATGWQPQIDLRTTLRDLLDGWRAQLGQPRWPEPTELYGYKGASDFMPTALITGITGQDGSYLAEFLLEQGYEVIGMVRRTSTINFDRIQHIQDRIEIVQGDLLDQMCLIGILQEHQPDEVYNLAAQSFVPTSFTQPVLTGEFTALGVTRVLEAIRIVDPTIRFYQASSQRDVRQGARGAAARDDALLPAQPLRRGQGLRPLDHGQLSRELQPATPVRASCSTTKARAAAWSLSRTRSRTASRASSWAWPTSCAWATWTRAATGALPATTCAPCG